MSATVRTRWSSRSICTERSYRMDATTSGLAAPPSGRRSPGPAVALAPVETGVRAGEHRREGVTRLGRRGAHRPREVMGRTELFQQFPGALLAHPAPPPPPPPPPPPRPPPTPPPARPRGGAGAARPAGDGFPSRW